MLVLVLGAEAADGAVVGVAADLDAGELRFSVDGEWGEPMGIAFDGVTGPLYPALTGQDLKLTVNFGHEAFKHKPPGKGYQPVDSYSRRVF